VFFGVLFHFLVEEMGAILGALIEPLGQAALNAASMDIPNATVYGLPEDLHVDKVANIFNSVNLAQTLLPLGSKLHETQLVMHVPESPPDCFFQWPARNIAWFSMPKQHISHGMNKFDFTSDFNVMENTDDFVHWAFAATLGFFVNGTDIYIAGKPKMSALGVVNMHLKMGKKLSCTYVPATAIYENPPANYSKALEEFVASGGMGAITLSCEYKGNLDEHLRNEIIRNFTDELKHPVTTPPPAPTTAASIVV
jgi:hypothetical protein